MADSFVPAWLPMAIGSFPQPEPQAAWDLVLKYTPVVPVWPQLPRRSFL